MKKGSPLSRRERERGFLFSSFERRKRTFLTNLQFREEKEKSENLFSSFEKRKRNLEKGSPLSRREREMDIIFTRFERRKRIPTRLFEKFSLSQIFAKHILTANALEKVKVSHSFPSLSGL